MRVDKIALHISNKTSFVIVIIDQAKQFYDFEPSVLFVYLNAFQIIDIPIYRTLKPNFMKL